MGGSKAPGVAKTSGRYSENIGPLTNLSESKSVKFGHNWPKSDHPWKKYLFCYDLLFRKKSVISWKSLTQCQHLQCPDVFCTPGSLALKFKSESDLLVNWQFNIRSWEARTGLWGRLSRRWRSLRKLRAAELGLQEEKQVQTSSSKLFSKSANNLTLNCRVPDVGWVWKTF